MTICSQMEKYDQSLKINYFFILEINRILYLTVVPKHCTLCYYNNIFCYLLIHGTG